MRQKVIPRHQFHIVSAFESTQDVVTAKDFRLLLRRQRESLTTVSARVDLSCLSTVPASVDNVRDVGVVKIMISDNIAQRYRQSDDDDQLDAHRRHLHRYHHSSLL